MLHRQSSASHSSVFESRFFIENWLWISQGCRRYFFLFKCSNSKVFFGQKKVFFYFGGTRIFAPPSSQNWREKLLLRTRATLFWPWWFATNIGRGMVSVVHYLIKNMLTRFFLRDPRVMWRGLRGNFNTPNRYFLYLQISVDLSGNLWRESEFQNIEWESLARIRVSEYIKQRKLMRSRA